MTPRRWRIALTLWAVLVGAIVAVGLVAAIVSPGHDAQPAPGPGEVCGVHRHGDRTEVVCLSTTSPHP